AKVGEQRAREIDVERWLAKDARKRLRRCQSDIDADGHGADAKTNNKGHKQALSRCDPCVPGSRKASCSSAPDANQWPALRYVTCTTVSPRVFKRTTKIIRASQTASERSSWSRVGTCRAMKPLRTCVVVATGWVRT